MKVIKLIPLPAGKDTCSGCIYAGQLDKCSEQPSCHQAIFKEVDVDPCTYCSSTDWAAKNPLYCTCCEHVYAAQHPKQTKVGH